RPGYNFFMQRCMAWDLTFLDPMHIVHLMKMHKMDTRGEIGAFFTYGYEFFEFTFKNWERLLQIGEKLDDFYSRFSWLCMLMYRITFNPFYIETCCVGMNCERFRLDSYEINRQFFQFSEKEVYVDGGTHVGYGVEAFLRAVKGKFKHIYTFEPLAEHNREIRKRLHWLRGVYLDRIEEKITIIEKGLWNGEGKLHFSTSHTHQSDVGFGAELGEMVGGAHFIEGGITDRIHDNEKISTQATELPVTSVDIATNQDATFIKFEVEGSELKAMEGAIKTITRNRPLMSIGIYHKPEDYVTLTEFVLNLDLDYKLGFRHHYPLGAASTVLYAYR
ncbi:MAG: FkbM family methyltransferase, partial [Alphaproteobacteria bacterium]|nr:FkbM family methyltransferase [Alphaproteobacteria bacterium]